MSHITLKDYIKQLENQGYDYNTRVAMAKEWASTHQPKSESVKKNDSVEIDPPIESDSTGSASGDGSSEYKSRVDNAIKAEALIKELNKTGDFSKIYAFNEKNPGYLNIEAIQDFEKKYNAHQEKIKKEREKFTSIVDFGEIYSPGDGYEYKFEVNEEGNLEYFTKGVKNKNFIKVNPNSSDDEKRLLGLQVANKLGHLKGDLKEQVEAITKANRIKSQRLKKQAEQYQKYLEEQQNAIQLVQDTGDGKIVSSLSENDLKKVNNYLEIEKNAVLTGINANVEYVYDYPEVEEYFNKLDISEQEKKDRIEMFKIQSEFSNLEKSVKNKQTAIMNQGGFGAAAGIQAVIKPLNDFKKSNKYKRLLSLNEKYGGKKYVENIYEPTPEAKALFKNELENNYDDTYPLGIGVVDDKIIFQNVFSKTVKNDPFIGAQLIELKMAARPLLEEKRIELQKKYDTSTKEGYDSANKEYEAYSKELIEDKLINSPEYQKRYKDLLIVGGSAQQDLLRDFQREDDPFFATLDLLKESAAGGEIVFGSVEQLIKTFKNFQLSFNAMQLDFASSDLDETKAKRQALINAIEKGEIKGEDTLPIRFSDRGVKGRGNMTVNDLIDKYSKDLKEDLGDVETQLQDIKEIETTLKGYDDIDQDAPWLTKTTQQFFASVPYMVAGLAGTGVNLLSRGTATPFIATGLNMLGAAYMGMDFYGQQWYDTFMQGVENQAETEGLSLEDMSDDQRKSYLIKALESGRYDKSADAAAAATLMVFSERFGLQKQFSAFGKALGLGKGGVASLIKGQWKQAGKNFLSGAINKSGAYLAEFGTEFSQQLIGDFQKGISLGLGSEYVNWKNNWEAGTQGGNVALLMPGAASIVSQTGVEIRNFARKIAVNFDLGGFTTSSKAVENWFKMANQELDTRFKNGIGPDGLEYTKEQYEADKNALNTTYNSRLKIPNNATPEIREKLLDLMSKKNALEMEINKIDDKDIASPQILELAVVKTQIQSLVKQEANIKTLTTSKARQAATKVAEQLGYKYENFQTQEAVDNRVQELIDEGAKPQAATSYGQAVELVDGSTVVLINDRVAAQDNVFTTDQHEILHPFLQQTFKNNPDAAIAFGKSLMQEIISNPDITINEKFKKDFEEYLNDENYTAANTWEEVIPLVSEALTNGDIKVKGNLTTVLARIKEFIQNFFGKAKQPLKIRFDKGSDVFAFLRDYNKTIAKGEGLTQAQLDIAKKGAEGALVTDAATIAAAKTGVAEVDAAQEILTEQDANRVEEQPLKAAAKKRIYQQVEDMKNDLVDPETKAATAFLIADMLAVNTETGGTQGTEVDRRLNINVDPQVKEQIILDFARDTNRGLVGLLEEYDPAINDSIMGYLNSKQRGRSLLDLRLQEFYENAPEYGNITQSMTDENVRRKVESTTDEGSDSKPKPEKEVATTQVDPREFGPVTEGNKLKDVEGIVKVTDKQRLTFKQLASKYFDKVSQTLFGMPGKKVKGNASLKYADVKGEPVSSEASKLQNIFKNVEDVRSFIKAMPPYNVATGQTVIDKQGKTIDVSKDIRGRSIAINPTVLKKFYQPVTRAIEGISNKSGRSLGSTSQTQVYELKPEYRGRITKQTIESLQKSLGITKGELSVPIKGPARTEFGSLLTGLSKMYVDNLINTVGRSKLTTDQAKADTGAGKSTSLAKKRTRINTKEEFTTRLLAILGELSVLRNKKQLAASLGFSSPPINESNRKAQQDLILEAVKTYGLDIATIKAGMMGSGGRQSFYGNIVDGKFVKKSEKNGGKKYVKTTDGEYILENSKRGRLKGGEVTNWVAKPGRLYYGNEDPAFQTLIKETKKYEGKKAKRVSVKGAFTEKSAKQSEVNMNVLDHVVNQLANAVAPVSKEEAKRLGRPEKGMSLDIAGAIIIQSYQATSGLIKIAAPFKYRSVLFEYAGPESKVGQRTGEKFREEHNPPASVIGAQIMFAIKYNAAKPIMKAIRENYYQTQLSKKDDNKLDMAKLDATLVEGQTIFDNPISRLAAAGINLQSLVNPFTGKTIAQDSGVGIDSKIYNNLNRDQKEQASAIQNQQIIEGLSNPELDVKKSIDLLIPLAPGKAKESKRLNNGLSPNSLKYDGFVPIDKVITDLGTADKALNNARRSNAPVKKIRVFDFDDTLAKSKSMVIVTMLDGTTRKINATQFAAQAADLQAQGAEFDFTEFSKVVEGKKGPLFDVAEKIAKARGTDDIFILTARPANAAGPIQAFMKANGINIPLNNITGLGDGTSEAKARWIASKAAEGYNDFYFADDAIKNVKAVKDVLSQIDAKSKVQVAKASKRKTFDTIVNDMIEDSSGIESYKTFSAAKARTIGRDKGRFDWLTMSSSAEDFKGLLYRLLGNGKKGEAQFEFLKNNLIDPYNRAEDSIIQAKISASNDFMALKQKFPGLPKTLETETGIGKFTYQHALRVYIWTKQGMSIPGISKADATKLNKFITGDTKLQSFADQLITIQKDKPYPEPGKEWLGGNLTTDIIGGINKINRAEYQQEWRENVEIIFSPENLNKMEAAYGTRWRKALENSLARMKAGTNRLGYNDSSNAILDWVNNSVGAVMFLNTRSALLQTISAVNFLNWGDNNIIKAGQAFANQKQYWSDFMTLMNSDFLVQRRNGLKINVSESEIADAVKDSQNKPKAAIAFLLSKGFVFTRYADSFAIASGGSTFYRNRIKKYLKEGMSQELAQEKAFNDFKDVAEESQQSSDPSKISMQQASGAGRVILNWANTPMQYVRIQKRDLQDLIAGRGDPKVKIARIAYYGVVQNLIFNALQQALFAIGFGDDDEEDEKKKKAKDKKIARVANGMIDSQLKGLGIAGMIMLSAKNTLMKIYEESKQKRPEYEAAAIEALSFSPAISSKYRKFVGGLKSFSWNMKEIKEKGFSLDNPAYLAGAQIVTAFTNLPIDRVMKKANNIRGILSEQSQMWQKVAMALGYSSYDVGLPYYGGWDKPIEPTEKEIKKQKFDKLKKDTKTQDQIDMLLNFGLTKKEIKALGKEDNRVKKIIELQNAEVKVDGEKVEVVKPKETNEEKLKRQFDSIKAENKPDQVKTLTKFGLSKKQIRNLKYEKDRVEKILELMNR